MSNVSGKSLLWNQLLLISESMDDPQTSIEEVRALLCGLEEGFAGVFDPADDFPEFTAHRMCQSVGRILGRIEQGALPGSGA